MTRGQERKARVLKGWGCALALLVAAVAAVALLAFLRAGITDQGGEPPVTVVNDSAVEVVVAYHFTEPVSGQDQKLPVEVRLPPGQSGPFYLAAHPAQCAGGRLVAVHGGQTVAVLEKPCAGATWRLIPDAPQGGS